jgi:hypothetical protein
MDLGEVGWGDVDWIGLAKDRNSWRALVNAVMNIMGFYKMATQLVASQVVLSSIELVSQSYNNLFIDEEEMNSCHAEYLNEYINTVRVS